MTSIIPVSEIRDTTKIQEMCEKEPVFVTRNGYGCMVVLSMDAYNELQEKLLDRELQDNYRKSLAKGGNREANEFLDSL